VKDDYSSKLSHRLGRLRWQLPVLAFMLVLVDQLLQHTWMVNLPGWGHFASQVFFYGIVGSALAWWALTALRRRVDETEATQRELRQAYDELTGANQRLEFLVKVNRRLAEAEDEESLCDVILDLPLEVVPALGCSLIRFDERGHPLPAIHRGSLDAATFDAWANHLSGAENQASCETCLSSRVADSVPCPQATSPPTAAAVSHVHCLALARGGREYGLLNIYLHNASHPGAREQTLLATMANEISSALESQYVRSRELATLYQLQQARRLTDLRDKLAKVLTHTVEALEVDGGLLFLVNSETAEPDTLVEVGRPLDSTLGLAQGLVSGVQQSESPLVISDLEQDGTPVEGVRSLLVAPLSGENRPLGSLVLWSGEPYAFTRRQVRLVATLAGQVSLLVENHWLYLQAGHHAALAERDRLAREIHDGLAQTLGYLKLRTAQMIGWLDEGRIRGVADGLGEIQGLLAEAYTDAREAIDGLRLRPGEGSLSEWLHPVLSEFHSLSGVQVETSIPRDVSLRPEVGTQLLRILQEALSNIRKHSNATRASLEWQGGADGSTVRIADNGRGFDAADVPPIAQHGLRIMRERAELLDADFQIISRPGAGTQVVIRLPWEDPKGFEKPSGSKIHLWGFDA
jgi:signal transduction histidine kinase